MLVRSGVRVGVRGFGWMVACFALVRVAVGAPAASSALSASSAPSPCRLAVVEGEVAAGNSIAIPIGGGLEVRLEALSWGSGWLLRVVPVGGPKFGQGTHDYAELATPPYASVNPLLLSTDYSFRAQDAVAWNPRRFRFARNAKEFAAISVVYERYSKVTPAGADVERELAAIVSKAPEGTLLILDAKFVPGTANQSQMAATVASHFSTTAHTVEEPSADGSVKGGPLGKLSWVRFRVSLEVTPEFRAERGLKIESHPCR
jgi:hypothetical protein